VGTSGTRSGSTITLTTGGNGFTSVGTSGTRAGVASTKATGPNGFTSVGDNGDNGAGSATGGPGMAVDGCGSSGSTAGFCSAGLRVVAIFYSYALFTHFFNHVV